MAQLSEDVRARANWLLDYLDAALDDLAGVIAGWNELSRDEHIDFWAEWPLKESRLAELDQLAADDCLSASQASRFRTIKHRLAAQRDALEHLRTTGQPLPRTA